LSQIRALENRFLATDYSGIQASCCKIESHGRQVKKQSDTKELEINGCSTSANWQNVRMKILYHYIAVREVIKGNKAEGLHIEDSVTEKVIIIYTAKSSY
jgi:hypothetical protein